MNLITDREKWEKFKIAAADPIHFCIEWEKQRRNTTSNISAYDRVEELHEQLTGCRRYSDFESFRRTRNRLKNHRDMSGK